MKYYYLLVLLLSFLFLSCEDTLRMIPENSVTFENAFENEHEIEIGLLTVERYVRKSLFLTTRPTDYGEYTDYRYKGDNGLLKESNPQAYTATWYHYYEIIALANVMLPHIDKVEMSQDRRDFYKGQVYFTNALVYAELGRKWGDCPIIKEEVEFDPISPSSWVQVIDYAIALASEAERLLPSYSSMTDYKGNAITYKSTPNKGAAQALLAHLCAWKAGCKYMAQPEEATYDEQALWVKADSVCTALITSGTYELANNPENVCTSSLVGDDPESIYEIVLRDCWNELESESPMSAHDIPYCFGRMYQTWPVIPGEGAGDISNCEWKILSSSVCEMYPQRITGKDTITDLRRDAYFYKVDSMAHDTLQHITGGYAYSWKWRLPRVATSGWQAGRFINFDQNRIVFRLADIILLRAECRARLGNNEGAIADLNTIRERADAELYNSSEYGGDLRYAIFKEREKELLMEGCRWYDVIRNGYYKTELYGGFRNVSKQDILDGVFFNAVDNNEFSENPLARQNTYWLKRM